MSSDLNNVGSITVGHVRSDFVVLSDAFRREQTARSHHHINHHVNNTVIYDVSTELTLEFVVAPPSNLKQKNGGDRHRSKLLSAWQTILSPRKLLASFLGSHNLKRQALRWFAPFLRTRWLQHTMLSAVRFFSWILTAAVLAAPMWSLDFGAAASSSFSRVRGSARGVGCPRMSLNREGLDDPATRYAIPVVSDRLDEGRQLQMMKKKKKKKPSMTMAPSTATGKGMGMGVGTSKSKSNTAAPTGCMSSTSISKSKSKFKSKSQATANNTLCIDTRIDTPVPSLRPSECPTSAPSLRPSESPTSTSAPSLQPTLQPTSEFCRSLETYPTNGHLYTFVTTDGRLTWPEAKEAAEALPDCCGAKAHLATISSAGEDSNLYGLAVRNDPFGGCRRRLSEEDELARGLQVKNNFFCGAWIGMSFVDSGFEWVTSELYPGPYTNWAGSIKPDGFYPYAAMFINALWSCAQGSAMAYF